MLVQFYHATRHSKRLPSPSLNAQTTRQATFASRAMSLFESRLPTRPRAPWWPDRSGGAACLVGMVLLASAFPVVSAEHAAGKHDEATLHSAEQLQHHHLPRVAVIGAGIGGATAAYYLNQLLDGQVNIHVYEKGSVGGRLKSLHIGDQPYELGGSMVYEGNQYIRDLADAMGLERVNPDADPRAVDVPFALYDGSQFVLNQSDWTVLTMLRMGMRYGTAPLRFNGVPTAVYNRFKAVYDLQANGTAFDTPESLLERMGLLALTQQRFSTFLTETLGSDVGSQLYGAELAGAVNRVNYNQGNSLNALVGLVSMLPAVDSRIFRIRGGNALLPERLLKASGAKIKSNWVVDTVKPAKHGRFELHASHHVPPPGDDHHHHHHHHHKHKHSHGHHHGHKRGLAEAGEDGQHDAAEQSASAAAGVGGQPRSAAVSETDQLLSWEQVVAGPYDAVIVAAPLEHSDIQFEQIDIAHRPKRSYQETVTTYVTGSLQPGYFGVTTLPTDLVLVTETADTPFSVISPLQRLDDGKTLYKLFSERPVRHLLHDMFADVRVVAEHKWAAYPRFAPPEQFAPFTLAPGIFYNNAWENAASAMEMSAIAGRNSALLARQHLMRRSLQLSAEQEALLRNFSQAAGAAAAAA